MSIYRIFPDDLEYFQLETNPRKTYLSSSVSGITGSSYLYAFRSIAEKEVFPLSMFSASMFSDINLDALRTDVANVTSSNKEAGVQAYMNAVHSQAASARLQQQLYMYRFVPPPSLNADMLRKNIIRETMFPYYRSTYPKMHWNTTNYNSFNFFSSSNTPTGSVLIYPNPVWYNPNLYTVQDGKNASTAYINFDSGGGVTPWKTQYQLSSSFTFDFWIKPTQQQDAANGQYTAGTILHMSSCYAITLHSGSSKDINNKTDKFRLCFQYGGDVVEPKLLSNGVNFVGTSSYGGGLYGSGSYKAIQWSSDNSLSKDKWQHVTVRWDDSVATGSILIDSTIDTYFSWSTPLQPVGFANYLFLENAALFVGNFYSGDSNVSHFFPYYIDSAANDSVNDIKYTGGVVTYMHEKSYTQYIATRGLKPDLVMPSVTAYPYAPSNFYFKYPLKAELSELKIYDKYLNTDEISYLQTSGPANLDNLVFYVPPFFTYESPIRDGEVLTPFQSRVSSSTNTPFATNFAFGVWGHDINLENYTRDLASGIYPRLWELSGSVIDLTTVTSTPSISANAFYYATGSHVKRLYTIMPCDNGNMVPNFKLLENLNDFRFRNDIGNVDYGVISLNNLNITSSYTASMALASISGSNQPILNNILGATPENLSAITGSSLAVLHRTRDTSSNQIVIFDISNIFYGKTIKPGTVTIKDTAISGSGFTVTLKDDGYGNLYRANTVDNINPTWASVGNVLYNEGLIVIKYPQLYFFGENQFEIDLKGTQNIHVMTLNTTAQAGTLISSSNTTFTSSLLSKPNEDLYNEADQRFVYVTGINIHDENLNVIMRTNLAQPIQKKSGDRIVFRNKIDY